jgi:hypothetical protein
MIVIELPDQQAAALQAKAAAQGLTLKAWLQKLADEETPHDYIHEGRASTEPSDLQRGSVVEEMRKLRARVKPDPEGWTTRDYINCGRR